MSTLDRTSDKPIVCRYDSSITKDHADKHYPVKLDVVAETGAYDHPTVALQGTADGIRIWGELGSVDPDTGTCQVYTKGLMYLRAKAAYDKADNGKSVVASDEANTVAPTTTAAVAPPILEGGFTIQEDGNDVNILKCRR